MANVTDQCLQIKKNDNFLFCYVNVKNFTFTVPFNNIDMCDTEFIKYTFKSYFIKINKYTYKNK